MGNIAVGIDTSKDKGKRSSGRRLIGVVVGKPSAISAFVGAVSSTATKNGCTGALHWKAMKSTLRHRLLLAHGGSLKAMGIEFRVFFSTRGDADRRGHYLKACPWVIGRELVGLIDERTDKMAIVAANDFDSLAPAPRQDSRQPTTTFLVRLIGKIASEIAMEQHLAPGLVGAEVNLTVCRKNAKPVLLTGQVGAKEFVEVQAADVLLGMYSLAKSAGKRLDGVLTFDI